MADSSPTKAVPAWLSAFKARTDLEAYGSNAIGLFALALRFNFEDLATVAAEAITDGGDDKKTDIVHIDTDESIAVIAQVFFSTSERRTKAAPASKASALNSAVNWLLLSDVNELPDAIRFSALELRDGIKSGEISKIYVWYVHNLPESKNVSDELKLVENTARTAVKALTNQDVQISALEVGAGQFEEWYNDTQSPILVNDDFAISLASYIPSCLADA